MPPRNILNKLNGNSFSYHCNNTMPHQLSPDSLTVYQGNTLECMKKEALECQCICH